MPGARFFKVGHLASFVRHLNKMNIQAIRQDTPGCEHHIHLNSAGASFPPKIVLETMQDYLHEEALHGGYEMEAAKASEISGFYEVFAQLVNAKKHNIAYATSATDGFSKALSSIPFERGDALLTTDDDYIANQMAFIFLQKRFGVKVIRAGKLPEGGVDPDSMKNLMEKHRPKLVAVTHVPTNSGLVQDVESIGILCRERDTWYLVDACQSAGQMPLDVERIGCDFLSATMRKWMRGPRGAAFLYTSDRVLDAGLEPFFPDGTTGSWVDDFRYELKRTARKFEYWERNYALMLGSKACATYAINLGLENIQERVSFLSSYTRQRIAELPGWQVLDRGKNRCGIVTAHLEGGSPKKIKNGLVAANINAGVAAGNALIDFREKGVTWALRISPHYYNTQEEVDALIEVLRKIVSK